jgi:hypothetical protein
VARMATQVLRGLQNTAADPRGSRPQYGSVENTGWLDGVELTMRLLATSSCIPVSLYRSLTSSRPLYGLR